MFRKEKSSGLI